MSNTPIYKLESVSRILTEADHTITLVQDVSFEVQKGEFIGITGPSGGGKSSLLYLLGLLDTPTTGKLYLDGIDTTLATEKEKQDLRLNKLGFVFQFHFLLPEFTSFENIMLPMRKLGKWSQKDMENRTEELLEYFGVINCRNKLPIQLSGGERQRIAVARALANKPAVILADEPTGNLDSKNSEIVFEYFEKIMRQEKTTIIMVTHESEMAKRTGRVLYVLDARVEELHHQTKLL